MAKPPRLLGGQGGRKPTMTDEEVLEARALLVFACWSKPQVMARYPHIAPRTVEAILDGINRARLVPQRKHLPEGVHCAR